MSVDSVGGSRCSEVKERRGVMEVGDEEREWTRRPTHVMVGHEPAQHMKLLRVSQAADILLHLLSPLISFECNEANR